MDLAKNLLRTTARAFYTTEEILVIDALGIHSTLTDTDLAHSLGLTRKDLRKQCGKLKDHGLLSVQTRAEKKDDAPVAPANTGGGGAGGSFRNREHVKYQDWYYLHFHHAIDAIKFRLARLNKHIDSLGAPTTEKKDLVCPRCKSQYTDLEVMDNIDSMTGSFLCHLCSHALEPIDEDQAKGENESKARLNTQVAAIEALLREIDSANVPENDFDTALSLHLPINRGEAHADRRVAIAEEIKPSIAGSKGLTLAPEKVQVSVLDDAAEATAKVDPEALRIKRESEAKQNMLPDWISKSTISGDITAVGAKEARERREREAHAGSGNLAVGDEEDRKAAGTPAGDDAVMDDYWAAYKAEAERERLAEEEEEEDDEDEDEFEDVDVGAAAKTGVPDIRIEQDGAGAADAVDAAPAAKRVKLEDEGEELQAALADVREKKEEVKPEESDEDDMEFEDV